MFLFKKGFKSGEVWQFLKYLEPHKAKLIAIACLVLFSTVLSITSPYLISLVIDRYIATKILGMDMVYSLLVLGGLYICLSVSNYFSTILVGNTSQTILFEIRQDLFTKIQNLPVKFFIENKSGDIISRINSDTQKLNNFLSQYIFEFISSFFTFIGIGIFIFFQNSLLALTIWAGVAVLIIFSAIVSPKIKTLSKQELESGANVTSFLNQNITNFKAIVAFGQQETLKDEFAKLASDNYTKSIKTRLLVGVFRPIYNFANLISQVIVALVGLYLIGKGELTTGLLVAFILYTQRFYDPINRLAAVFAAFQQALGAWSRILEVIKLSPDGELKMTTKTLLEKTYED